MCVGGEFKKARLSVISGIREHIWGGRPRLASERAEDFPFLHFRKARDRVMLGVILSWVFCGLVIGIIARIVVPGRHPLGIIGTIGLGIIGAFVGGFLAWLFKGTPGEPFSFSADSWHGWIMSFIGASLVLWITGWMNQRSRVS